jgi:hypothetical protein
VLKGVLIPRGSRFCLSAVFMLPGYIDLYGRIYISVEESLSGNPDCASGMPRDLLRRLYRPAVYISLLKRA